MATNAAATKDASIAGYYVVPVSCKAKCAYSISRLTALVMNCAFMCIYIVQAITVAVTMEVSGATRDGSAKEALRSVDVAGKPRVQAGASPSTGGGCFVA